MGNSDSPGAFWRERTEEKERRRGGRGGGGKRSRRRIRRRRGGRGRRRKRRGGRRKRRGRRRQQATEVEGQLCDGPCWHLGCVPDFLHSLALVPGVFQSPCPSKRGSLPAGRKGPGVHQEPEGSQPLPRIFTLSVLSSHVVGEPGGAASTGTQLLCLLQGEYLISKPNRSNAAGGWSRAYLSPCPEVCAAEQTI